MDWRTDSGAEAEKKYLAFFRYFFILKKVYFWYTSIPLVYFGEENMARLIKVTDDIYSRLADLKEVFGVRSFSAVISILLSHLETFLPISDKIDMILKLLHSMSDTLIRQEVTIQNSIQKPEKTITIPQKKQRIPPLTIRNPEFAVDSKKIPKKALEELMDTVSSLGIDYEVYIYDEQKRIYIIVYDPYKYTVILQQKNQKTPLESFIRKTMYIQQNNTRIAAVHLPPKTKIQFHNIKQNKTTAEFQV
ncbi:MAG: hypothetical protein Q6363_004265 [Candidatus Njordarchaeota archaeon]